MFIKIGAHNVLITNPRDLPGSVKELKKIRFTGMIGVNTLYYALLHTPGFSEIAAHTLKLSSAGGYFSSLSRNTRRRSTLRMSAPVVSLKPRSWARRRMRRFPDSVSPRSSRVPRLRE